MTIEVKKAAKRKETSDATVPQGELIKPPQPITMPKKPSPTQIWTGKMTAIQDGLEHEIALLEADYERALDDLNTRLKHDPAKGLRVQLEDSRRALQINMSTMREIARGCNKLINKEDARFIQKRKQWEELFPEEELDGMREDMEMREIAITEAEVVKMVTDTKVLCKFLKIILSHSASQTIQKSALKELLGAIFDPGQGYGSLIQRTIRVIKRKPGGDTATTDTLNRLEGFEELLDQWLRMVQEMGKGKSHDEAMKTAFKKWIK